MRERLASVNLKTGKIHLSRSLKGRYRQRVRLHEETYLARRLAGDSYTEARRLANKRERGKMTKKEWLRYNGKLGAIARWKK